MSTATLSPEIETIDSPVERQHLPAEFSIVRVFLVDGRCREGTWTGDVWWLRCGTVVLPELVASWEPLLAEPACAPRAQFRV